MEKKTRMIVSLVFTQCARLLVWWTGTEYQTCPKTRSDRTDYLQVDMGEVRFLCGVATQGLLRGSAWTTSYKLQLSTNGTTWNTYRETNIEKVRRELYVIDVFRN